LFCLGKVIDKLDVDVLQCGYNENKEI